MSSFRHHHVHIRPLCFTYVGMVDKPTCVCVSVCVYKCVCTGPVPHGSVSTQPITPHGHKVVGVGGWELLTLPPSSKRWSRRCGLRVNRAAIMFTSVEPGKALVNPIFACISRQGGKWTYRCSGSSL